MDTVDQPIAVAPTESAPTRVRRAAVIINARSGTPGKQEVADRVRAALSSCGVDANVTVAGTAEQLTEAAAAAASGDAHLVVAGGGDGTIAGIAAGLLDSGKTLAVLPLGTFNYFARRIGVPDVDAAIDVLVTGAPRPMSVGEVNGRVFLNNSSIGVYPTVLRKREATYLRTGRSQLAAYLSAAFVLLQPPALLNLRIVADGVPLARRTPLLFVGANPQQLAQFGAPGSECIESGRLSLYTTRALAPPQLWKLAARAFVQGLHGADELEAVCARELVVTLRRPRVRVAMDGEIAKMTVPLRYRLRVDALRVQMPVTPASDAEGEV